MEKINPRKINSGIRSNNHPYTHTSHDDSPSNINNRILLKKNSLKYLSRCWFSLISTVAVLSRRYFAFRCYNFRCYNFRCCLFSLKFIFAEIYFRCYNFRAFFFAEKAFRCYIFRSMDTISVIMLSRQIVLSQCCMNSMLFLNYLTKLYRYYTKTL